MTKGVRLAVVIFSLSFQATFAAQPVFQTGKIVTLQRKTRSHVLYYIVNTPITREDAYYEIAVQLKNTIYTGEYEARHSGDALPDEWAPGLTLRVDIEKHHMILRSAGTAEYKAIITRRLPANMNSRVTTRDHTP